ncbi:hypothetical protein [Embleya sp. NPDC050493]|uniref:hypothetical protein n=1 Tax=Embleya sp. NPDC050493 TaxID=3363989 RepID=UPI0037B24EF5
MESNSTPSDSTSSTSPPSGATPSNSPLSAQPPTDSRRYGRAQARNLRRYERGQWELREALRSRVIELEALLKSKTAPGPLAPCDQVLADQAFESLDEAKRALGHEHGRPAAHIAVAQTKLDVAYIILLRLLTLQDVTAHLPGIVAFVKEHLPLGDERRAHVDEIALSVRAGDTLTENQREVLVDASTVAHQVHLKEKLRVRSFAYIVFGVTAALAVIATLIALAGAASPGTVPLCFNPGVGIVCATATSTAGTAGNGDRFAGRSLDQMYADVASQWDYPVVELVGLVAAAVAAAASLRRIHGTSTPYNVPVALALLKLPTGALTALLGLLLMRGEFIPGLSALDSSAQIIAWAVIFGYAQQLFTRFVDNQAQLVLNSVGGPVTNPGKTTRNSPAQPG